MLEAFFELVDKKKLDMWEFVFVSESRITSEEKNQFFKHYFYCPRLIFVIHVGIPISSKFKNNTPIQKPMPQALLHVSRSIINHINECNHLSRAYLTF